MGDVKGFLELTPPQAAGRSSQAASSDPRLVEKIVARGSWFVARTPPPLDKNGLWLNFTAGCPPQLSVLVTVLRLPPVGT